MAHKFIPIDCLNGSKVASTCACGWQGNGLNSREAGAKQQWMAHMYAGGYRTAEQIKEAENEVSPRQD